MSADRNDVVRRLLESAVRAGSAPGMVAGWQSSTEATPRIVVVGNASVHPSPVPITPVTWFDLASLTKPLVIGTLVLLTMRDGTFSPTTTVAEVLAETSDLPVGLRTVSQLLTHTSGLPAWEPLYALSNGRREASFHALIRLNTDDPDTRVVYSCPGFVLLGVMLERITGAGLAELFTERVVRPLKLDDEIGFQPDRSRPLVGAAKTPGAEELLLEERGLDPRFIPATSPGQPDDGNSRFLGGVSGNAGLFGTVTGVLKLARVYLGAGEFLGVEEIGLATTDHTAGLEQARGFGWQLGTSSGCSAGPALGPASFGHTGFTGTSLWVDPAKGIAMALLTNLVHPGHRQTDLHPLRRRFHQLVVDQYT